MIINWKIPSSRWGKKPAFVASYWLNFTSLLQWIMWLLCVFAVMTWWIVEKRDQGKHRVVISTASGLWITDRWPEKVTIELSVSDDEKKCNPLSTIIKGVLVLLRSTYPKIPLGSLLFCLSAVALLPELMAAAWDGACDSSGCATLVSEMSKNGMKKKKQDAGMLQRVWSVFFST